MYHMLYISRFEFLGSAIFKIPRYREEKSYENSNICIFCCGLLNLVFCSNPYVTPLDAFKGEVDFVTTKLIKRVKKPLRLSFCSAFFSALLTLTIFRFGLVRLVQEFFST